MENMDKGLTVPKWMLIVWKKIPQMPQNLFNTTQGPVPISLFRATRILYDAKTFVIQKKL